MIEIIQKRAVACHIIVNFIAILTLKSLSPIQAEKPAISVPKCRSSKHMHFCPKVHTTLQKWLSQVPLNDLQNLYLAWTNLICSDSDIELISLTSIVIYPCTVWKGNLPAFFMYVYIFSRITIAPQFFSFLLWKTRLSQFKTLLNYTVK